MLANTVTMEVFRVSKVKWYVLSSVHSQSPKKLQRIRIINRNHHNNFNSLNVSEPDHHGGLQGVKSVMVGHIEGSFTGSKNGRGVRMINRNHHNNFNSLKASMVTGFMNMIRKKTTLLLMIRSPVTPRLFFLEACK